MSKTQKHDEWVLWGFHPSYASVQLKVAGGSLPRCRREMDSRKAEGWTNLHILRPGVEPLPVLAS